MLLVDDHIWWKNAIIYCLDMETFFDSTGDGVGDLEGLRKNLEHLAGLGVTCVWLMPFYPSPNRDDGYDVTDYYSVDDRLGDLGRFVELVRAADERGIRVIVDLVVNHTSIDHPWFQSARKGPDSPYHDFYVWRDEPDPDWPNSLVFPGSQESNWTFDREAGQYYMHRFYSHQPDLNPQNRGVRQEIGRIMGFWARLGVSGFRVDAVPFLIETGEPGEHADFLPHDFLRDLAAHLRRRRGDALLLGEVNLEPRDQREYFGDADELEMVLAFYVNQHIYLSLARHDATSLGEALRSLPQIPATCQWAHFLTNHDELTLDKLSESERQEVFEAFGPDPSMQIFGRGIRRRLPPMVGGDGPALRMLYSLLFALPGAPVLFYGEEIGLGDNLSIEGRGAVRTPMQWSSEANGGFSTASPHALRRPLPDGDYGPDRVNVEDQERDPDSLLSWMTRLIRYRRETPIVGDGDWSVVDVGDPRLIGIRYEAEDQVLITLHNLSPDAAVAKLRLDHEVTAERWANRRYERPEPGSAEVEVDGWGYRWLAGAPRS